MTSSNSTKTFWDVDGVSLQTFAYNIQSWGGDRQAPPSLRGDNIRLPYMPGEIWLPKVADSRTMSLAMWVQGANRDGLVDDDQDTRDLFERNWRMLRSLLWDPDRQMVLTKRWYDDNGVLRSASAKAQFASGLAPTMQGDLHATFTVDLLLADPFFYGPYETLNTPSWVVSPGSAVGSARIDGDVKTSAFKIRITGPLTTPRITITSDRPGGSTFVSYLQYNGPGINTSGHFVDIDTKTRSVTFDGGGVGSSSSAYLSFGPDYEWLTAYPGTATVTLTEGATTPTGAGLALRYAPTWL